MNTMLVVSKTWQRTLKRMLLCVSIPQLKLLLVHPLLGEKIECAAISPHLHMLSYIQMQCHLLLLQLHSDLGDFVMEFVVS